MTVVPLAELVDDPGGELAAAEAEHRAAVEELWRVLAGRYVAPVHEMARTRVLRAIDRMLWLREVP